jgi:hypothetical protein
VVARVSERLDTMHSARAATVRAQRRHFGEIDIRLVRMAATGRRVIASAYRAGWTAGDRVNLNRPVPGDPPRQLT